MAKNRSKKRINRSRGGDIVLVLVLAIVSAFMIFPIVFNIGNAFKSVDEYWTYPPTIFPKRIVLDNFIMLSSLANSVIMPMSRFIFNSILYTSVGTIGQIVFASMCAYPLAKMNFPGKKILFQIIVVSLMFNGTVLTIPSYLVFSTLGWIDNPLSIIVPAFSLPIGLYLMKQFMEQMVPDTVLEAARIDGAKEYVIFWKIVMPMVRPAWLTLIIFSVQALWGVENSVLIQSDQFKTLSFFLNQIATSSTALAGVGSVVSIIMLSVPLITFMFTQSNIIATMSTSGMKD